MIGLSDFKQLVVENETDYHLSAQNYKACQYCRFNQYMNEIQLQQKHGCFKGGTLELKVHKLPLNVYFIIKLYF